MTLLLIVNRDLMMERKVNHFFQHHTPQKKLEKVRKSEKVGNHHIFKGKLKKVKFPMQSKNPDWKQFKLAQDVRSQERIALQQVFKTPQFIQHQ